MLISALFVAHIAVLGYWLGSELVINSTYRYVSWSADMPFAERDRLMDHVMDVDQHVRYALILQAGLGTMLAALLGYAPGGAPLAVLAALLAIAWLALAEATHRLRRTAAGTTLAWADRSLRYAAMAALAVVFAIAMLRTTHIPPWLAWKLLLFGGVIACGLGIRAQLIRFYVTWRKIEHDGTDPALEQDIRHRYVVATSILGLLWLCIGAIVMLSVWKP